jgi:putative nucleotidyltransferase with HDIG domain
MTSADVFDQIEKMGELPSLPQHLLQIQQVATNTKSSADDLAQSILQDQALTMRVLRVVNSAMYQRRNQEQVRTVRRAVIMMGFDSVRKLALGLSVFDMMSKLSRSPYLATITRHSLVTAAFAQVLAEATGRVMPEEAFVTALIHDIGKVVLLECSPEAMDHVLHDMKGGMDALEAERRSFGITHDRAGRRLAARWQLPMELQNAIGDHHDIDPLNPPRGLDPMLGVIVYANTMSRFTGEPANIEHEHRTVREACRALGIPRARLDLIHARVCEEVADLAANMGLDNLNLADLSQVVNVDGSASVAPRGISPEELRARTTALLELYRGIGEGIAVGGGPDDLVATILAGAVHILGFERVVMLTVDRKEHRLRPAAWDGPGAEVLARRLDLPLTRETGALALAVFDRRNYHVPMASSEAYGHLAGDELLAVARCRGFVVAPVMVRSHVVAVIYADCGADGEDVVVEQAHELGGLASQLGLVLGLREVLSSS